MGKFVTKCVIRGLGPKGSDVPAGKVIELDETDPAMAELIRPGVLEPLVDESDAVEGQPKASSKGNATKTKAPAE